MKTAAMKDFWRALHKVLHPAKGISRIEQVGDAKNILVPDGVFAVVGSNGSGKSSFFRFLTEKDYDRLPFIAHKIELQDGRKLDLPGDVVAAVIIDPLSELRRSNDTLKGFASTFDQKEMIVLKPDERGLLNYVIGSNYDDLRIEEVETADSEICPRFVAFLNGRWFDNNSLSLGEQLVLYIYWVLTKKYNAPGIFFIEEPESGLAPIAQLRIADLLVYIASNNAKQLFLATHSPFIVSRLGNDRVLLMKKDSPARWVNSAGSNYLEELGMDLGHHGIFYVEDNKARIFLEKLLDVYGSILRKTFDIVFLGGESEVYEVVSRVAGKERNIRAYGVLDADQRNDKRYTKNPGYFFFLPGSLSPEEEVIGAVSKDPIAFATNLSTNAERVKDALRRCRSLDHHDFFEEVSKDLYDEVRVAVYESAFKVWLSTYVDRDAIHVFMKTLDPHLTQENIDEVDKLYPIRI